MSLDSTYLMNNRLIFTSLCYIITFFSCFSQSEQDSLFSVLEERMGNRQQFDEQKERILSGLKSLLVQNGSFIPLEDQYQINNKIIEEYWSFSFDSTLTYLNRNLKIANELSNIEWKNKLSVDLSLLLASTGSYKESQDILSKVNRNHLTKEIKVNYYNCYRKIYSDLDYFALQPDSKTTYGQLYKLYTDSVMPFIEQKEDDYLFAQEWELMDEGRFDECLMLNSLRLSKAEIASESYSYITFQRSMIYEQMGDNIMEQKYLILSAISDIMASRKDNASLAKLALRIYNDGDIGKAYKYITYSFEDATFYNSKLRFVEIANSLSLILESHQILTRKKNRSLLIFTITVSVLSLMLFMQLFFVLNQKKKLQKAQKELRQINLSYKELNSSLEQTMDQLKVSYQDLAESNNTKELYIGNFMKICSDFIDKMDKYRLAVNKMLRAKKYEKLFDMTKTDDSIQDEIEIFYSTFDKTFISLYPDFVNDLNNLLKDEERITLKSDEILNPELRIFAVIRLGIKDSARIAQLLRYSVNTIYNYRVKIKNKAKGNRDDFEEQVMKIGSYSIIQ